MDTMERTLPDGAQLMAVKPDALVENLADWRNDREGGGGEGKPRVFVLRDGHFKQISALYRHIVTPVAFTAIGETIYHVYRDETLWVEVLKAEIIDALDLVSVAGDLLVDAPTPSCNESDEFVYELTPKGKALVAKMQQPRFYLTDKARAFLAADNGAVA